MKRVVIMVFSYDNVCFPSKPPLRLMKAGTTLAATTDARSNIIEALKRFLAEHGVTVEDVEEADGDACFAVVLLARQTSPEPGLTILRERLKAYGQTLGVTIRVQREDLFLAMHRI